MKEFTDYYKVLGIDETATQEEVREAFRRRVRELSPGPKLDDTVREEFEKLAQARDVLTDPDARRKYNKQYNNI